MGKKLDKLAARVVALEKAIAALVTGKRPKSKGKKKSAKAKEKTAKPAKKAKSKKAKAAPVQPPIGNL